MMKLQRKSAESGFTIIELMIALVVTTLGIAGLLSMHGSMSQGNMGARFQQEASHVAMDTIEQVRAFPGEALLENAYIHLNGGGTTGAPAEYIDTVSAPSGMSYARFWYVEDRGNYIHVRIEVAWNDDASMDPSAAFDHLVALEFTKDRFSGG